MKIATWNVNSLKVRLPQVLDWLSAETPDILCLQETKCADEAFPQAAFTEAGYHVLYNGQKTYNGVALVSRQPMHAAVRDLPDFADPQKRLIAASLDDLRVVCAYMPNGQAVGSDKYAYKLQWFAALTEWLRAELERYPRLALLGDFNIAPEDCDVHDPIAWQGQILCSDAERAAFRQLLDLGLTDAFRLFDQPEKSFSWWDYRMLGFRRNLGLRIDHILLSAAIANNCTACSIDRAPRKLERPSDHAPVLAELT